MKLTTKVLVAAMTTLALASGAAHAGDRICRGSIGAQSIEY